MIQIEIIKSNNEDSLVNDVNYFLSQLEGHLFIEIKYSTDVIKDEVIYSCLIVYRVE